jgi:hypothetical protein
MNPWKAAFLILIVAIIVGYFSYSAGYANGNTAGRIDGEQNMKHIIEGMKPKAYANVCPPWEN